MNNFSVERERAREVFILLTSWETITDNTNTEEMYTLLFLFLFSFFFNGIYKEEMYTLGNKKTVYIAE